jgi:excisionase family DNA binding protein
MQTIAQATPSKRAHLERATYTLAEFAALLGISYTQAHESAQAGTLAVTPIRQGRKYLFPRAAVHRLLEIDAPADDAA